MITIYIDPAVRPQNEDSPFLKRFKVNASHNQHSDSKKIIILVTSIVTRHLYDFFLNSIKDIGITTQVSEFKTKSIPLILSYKNGIEKELEKINFDELYIIDDLGELPHKLFASTSPLNSKNVFYSTTDLAFETSILNNFNGSKNTFFIHSDILIDNITTLRLSHLFSEDDEKKDFFRTLALFGTKDQLFITEHNYVASSRNKKLKCTSVRENYNPIELSIKDIKIQDYSSNNQFSEEKEYKLDKIAERLSCDNEIQKNSEILEEMFNNQLHLINKNLGPITENIGRLSTLFVDLANKIDSISDNRFNARSVETSNNELELFDQLAAFRENQNTIVK